MWVRGELLRPGIARWRVPCVREGKEGHGKARKGVKWEGKGLEEAGMDGEGRDCGGNGS